MSKKAKTKPEVSPPPPDPADERGLATVYTPGGQQEYLRPEEVEPSDVAKWDEATFDDAVWP